MRNFLKIILLLLVIFPLWLTIIAFSAPLSLSELWKNKLNTELLKVEERKIQIIEIVPLKIWPAEIYLEQAPELILSELKPWGISTISLKYKDSQNRLLQLIHFPVKALIQDYVAVATRSLAQEVKIRPEDFKLGWKDLTSLKGVPARPETLIGKEIRRFVLDGSVIYQDQLTLETWVKRGERVKVIVDAPGICLTTVGLAQQSGKEGDTIRVINVDSQKEILGVVIGPQEVRVKL